MRTEQIQPGYRVTSELHDLVKDFAEKLSEKHGFHVSVNKAVAILIRAGHEDKINELIRG
jgi:hypothetical protein